MTTSTKKICIRQLPNGVPDPNADFGIETVNLPRLEAGEILVEAEWISVDPYLRGKIPLWGVGRVMQSGQVARVLVSRDSAYEEGEYVFGYFQWATRSVIKGKDVVSRVPSRPTFSRSHYVGAYGMPSKTAWYGLFNVGKLRRGERVFVSGAAGAVGSYVCQIAKLHDCYVVGICGTDSKCEYLRSLGVDAVLNYRTFKEDSVALQKALGEVFPEGIDVYFDNTGGFITASVWDLLNNRGRVLICGQIANYNRGGNLGRLTEKGGVAIPKIDDIFYKLIYREIHIRGFLVNNFSDQREFNIAMKRWIESGQLRARETIVEGFDRIPEAFVGLFSGRNTGKMVVRCADFEEEKEDGGATAFAGRPVRVLMVLSGYTEMPQTAEEKAKGVKPSPTGWFIPEVAHPWHEFVAQGYQVTFVSPKGGLAACDAYSLKVYAEDPVCNELKAKVMHNGTHMRTVRIDQVEGLENYGIIFYAGGHGTMWDFPDCQHQNEAAARIFDNGGIVSAVCHGPAGLINVVLKNGKHLLDGKSVTGFTNSEEDAVFKSSVMPFMLETVMKERGAEFRSAKDFSCHVTVDGNLVTGQNPASGKALAQAVIEIASKW